MLSTRGSLGVAQIIFYVPAAALSIWLAIRHGKPRIGWVFMIILSLIRISAGALLIAGAALGPQDINSYVYFGIYDVLIHVTFFQLLSTTHFFFAIIRMLDFPNAKNAGHLLVASRIFGLFGFVVATVGSRLQIIPGSVVMHRAANDLFKAGAICACVMVLCYAALACKAWTIRNTLSNTSQKIILGILSTIVLYVLRLIWFCLAAFSTDWMWYQIFGSLGAFIGMALLPEYLILAIHIFLGFAIPEVSKADLAEHDQNNIDRNESVLPKGN